MLARAMRIQATSSGAAAQGFSFAQQKRWPEAIDRYQLAIRLDNRNIDALYRLSLAYALSGDEQRARAAALELARVAPNFPPLREWLSTLGVQP
jgi:tetratricopeptide (TPR) repeat protein